MLHLSLAASPRDAPVLLGRHALLARAKDCYKDIRWAEGPTRLSGTVAPSRPDPFGQVDQRLPLSSFLIMSTPDPRQRDGAQKRVDDCRVALQDAQLTSANRGTLLKEFADALHILYSHSRNAESIDEAIPVLEELALLQPDGDQKRWDTLFLLGRFLVQSCTSHRADAVRATRSIEVLREALRLLPSSDPNGHRVRSVLAAALGVEFESRRNVDALAEAISLYRENMDLFAPGNDSHIAYTNSLSLALQSMYEDQGDDNSLQEALTLMRGSLLFCPPGHPGRAQCLHNLAMVLRAGFWQHSDLKLLAESIYLQREVLELCPPDHSRRDLPCNNLAFALLTQSDRNGDPESLSEAIVLLNEALTLRSAEHPERPDSLNNLANAMLMRFERYQDSAALTMAIAFLRESCKLRPSKHFRRPQSLDILAKALVLYFRQHGDWSALTEAITVHREVLQSRPQGHPLRPSSLINLGHAFRAHFERQGDNQFLEEEIATYKAGLQSCPEALPSRAHFLFLMSHCLLRVGTPVFDFMEGISYIMQGLTHQTLSTMERLHEGIRCLGAMERAYGNDDLGLNTKSDCDHAILELYVQVIRLLPRAANLGLNHTARLRAVAGSDGVSRNAAMRAITMGRGPEAVEMLEEGRGIFWSQALCLRASGLDCVPDEDRHTLQEIFRVLEQGINRVDEPNVTISQYERQVEARRRLSEQAENLIETLRSQPGLERLLMPSAFSSLIQRMPQGIVVILLASDLGSCALILDRNSAQARTVALTSSPDSVGLLSDATRATLPRDLELYDTYQDVNSHRLTLVKSTIDQSAELLLLNTLRKLWTSIVRPIIENLALKVSLQPAHCGAFTQSLHREHLIATVLASGGV
jgi:hypothetical protein